MICIEVVRIKSTDDIESIFISGHSNYSKIGSDIVCSAVSTATFTSVSLLQKSNCKMEFLSDEKKPIMKIKIIEATDFTNLVLNNLLEVLKGIEEDYSKYLKINENRR